MAHLKKTFLILKRAWLFLFNNVVVVLTQHPNCYRSIRTSFCLLFHLLDVGST